MFLRHILNISKVIDEESLSILCGRRSYLTSLRRGRMSRARASRNVALRAILEQLLKSMECSLATLSSKPVAMSTKSSLQSLLFRFRISIGKFLIAYRWVRKHGAILENQSAKMTNTCDVAAVCHSLQELCLLMKSVRLNTSDPSQEELPNLKKEMYTVNPMSDVVLAITTLLQEGHFHLTQVRYKGKKILLDAWPYYLLGLRVQRGGLLKGSLIGHKWPIGVQMPQSAVKRIAQALRSIDPRERGILKRIDSLFLEVAGIGKMMVIVQELQKIIGYYDGWIVRECGCVYLKFRACFEPFNVFRIELQGEVVLLRSIVPMWVPAEIPFQSGEAGMTVCVKEFTRHGIPEEVLLKKRILCLQLTLENLGEVMTEVRNRMFYCRVHTFTRQLNMAVHSCHLTRAYAVWRCNIPDFSGSYISLSLDDLDIGSIIFDPRTGTPIYQHPDSVPGTVVDNVDLENMDILDLLNKAFYSITCIHEQTLWFRNHWQSLRVPYYTGVSSGVALLYTTFSSKYCLQIRSGSTKPQICVTNNETWEEIASPYSVIMDSVRLREIKKDTFDGVFFASKLDIVVLSLMELLTEKHGCICQRRGRGIRFMGPFGAMGRLCIYKSFAWSLMFEKDPRVYPEKGMIIIRGTEMSINFVKYIANMIDTVLIMCDLDWQTFLLANYRTDMMAYIDIGGCRCYLEVGPWEDVMHEAHITRYTVTNYRHATITSRWLQAYSINLRPNFSSSYQIRSSFVPFMRSAALFIHPLKALFHGNRQWTILEGVNLLHFIFQESLSMNVRYGTSACFYIVQVKTGFSSPLLVPIGNVTKQVSGKDSPIVQSQVRLPEMERVKEEVEKYGMIFSILQSLKFDIFEYKDQGQQKFLYAKSSRFYLIEATVSERGIVMSSPAFPALREITTAISESESHTFSAKSKFVKFLAAALYMEGSFTKQLFDTFRVIVAVDRLPRMELDRMADESWLSPETATFGFCVIENGEKMEILYVNPEGDTITVRSNGREAEYPGAVLRRMLSQVDARPLCAQLLPIE